MAAKRKAKAEKEREPPATEISSEPITVEETNLEETLEWEGITIRAHYRSHYCGGAHIELHVVSPEKAPIPVTDTGYRSHFHKRGAVEEAGGPAAFTKAWLDYEAQQPAWKARAKALAAPKQLDLFA